MPPLPDSASKPGVQPFMGIGSRSSGTAIPVSGLLKCTSPVVSACGLTPAGSLSTRNWIAGGNQSLPAADWTTRSRH